MCVLTLSIRQFTKMTVFSRLCKFGLGVLLFSSGFLPFEIRFLKISRKMRGGILPEEKSSKTSAEKISRTAGP
jgi:hypothetical protein